MAATLREVAAAAGASLATASRALGGGVCAAATRQRVQEAAQRLGWRPDPGLARLIERRWRARPAGNLLVQLYESAPPLPTGWADDLRALRRAARTRGWTVHAEALDAHANAQALCQRLAKLGTLAVAVGLIHAPAFDLQPVWRRYPAVGLGLASHRPAIPVASADDWGRARAAWAWMAAQGHRRIGVALPAWPEAQSVAMRRSALRDGWLNQVTQLPWCVYPDPDDIRPVLAWIAAQHPDALLVHDATTAEALRTNGVALPIACLVTFTAAEARRWPGSLFDRDGVAAAGLELLETQVRAGAVGSDLAGLLHLVEMPYVSPAASARS